MKTNELIEHLKKVDPDGKYDVLVGNMDILPSIYVEAGYWDGRMKLAEYNEGSHHPDRIRVTSGGGKINLNPIDPQDYFVMSILDKRKEFDYDVEGGSKVYPFNHEQFRMLDTKMGWLYIAESYCSWYFNHERRKDFEGQTKELIATLKKKYADEAKNAQLAYVEKDIKGKTKDAAIDLINKIYEYAPTAILGSISHSSDSIHIRLESSWKYEFSITKSILGIGGGTVKVFTSGKGSEKIELVLNEELFKDLGETVEIIYKNRVD